MRAVAGTEASVYVGRQAGALFNPDERKRLMMFEFLLFAILGWCVFATPPAGQGRTVLMIVFVVMMVIWLVAGIFGWHVNFPPR
jgi:predicted membrane channel-forming protein YqfA (hemolysin III family)